MLNPKAHIARLRPAVHGGIDHARLTALGISPEQVLDFSVSLNPYGPPPAVRASLKETDIAAYPDSATTRLTNRLAEVLNISAANLIAGAGATELIRLAALCYLGADDTLLITTPTYGEYEVAARLSGARVITQPTRAEDGFQLDVAETLRLIKEHRPRAVFLCNPNNPTGSYLARDDVVMIIASAPDSLIVLDEAYIAFTDKPWPSLELIKHPNLLIIRSLTKDYALAGLRLGYAVADGSIINTLKKARPPWNVSAPAQSAGLTALADGDYLKSCAAKIKKSKAYLSAELASLGCEVLPSATNFFLVKVGDGAAWQRRLLERGLLVRDGASFGLPEYIRLAPRTPPECRRLVTAIKEISNRKE